MFVVTVIPPKSLMINELLITQDKLHEGLKEVIENEGALLHDDVVFIKSTLDNLLKESIDA